MTETIGRAVARKDARNDAVSALNAQIASYTDDYAKVLPQHINAVQWVRLAQGLLRRNEGLAEAAVRNPGSLLSALLDCARLGHEPGTDAYALVVYGGEITGVEQYQGEIERMYRAGAVQSVVCQVVREKDYFQWTPGQLPSHDADWFAPVKDRGDLVGVYAFAYLKGGGHSQVVVLSGEEVAKHRDVARTKNIWDKWTEAMWRKTAIHELEKWVPTSAEYRREQLRAIAEADTIRQQAVYVSAEQVPATHHTTTTDEESTDE